MPQAPRHRPSPALLWALCAAAATALGCQVGVIDLGSNRAEDAGTAAPDAGTAAPDLVITPVTTSNCPYVTEADVQALYGHPCYGATCSGGLGTPRAVGSAAELVAVTATRWQTCDGDVPWGADVVGIEFQAGCTLFLLHEAPDGGGDVRGVTPDDQGTFNVIETSIGLDVDRRLQLFFPSWTLNVAVTTSDCPHRMRFQRADGSGIDFAAVNSTTPPLQ